MSKDDKKFSELMKTIELGVNAAILESLKIKGIMQSIKRELKKEKIERLECKYFLFEFKTAQRTMGDILVRTLKNLEKIRSLRRSKDLSQESKPTIAVGTESYDDRIKEQESSSHSWDKTVDKIIGKIDAKRSIDEKLRNELFDLVTTFEIRLNILDTYLLQQKNVSKSLAARIYEFTALKIGGLDENWVPAACYLASIDILVNKKRKQFGINYPLEKKETNLPFEQRYRELIAYMEKNGVKISELMKPIPEAFWDIRTKVLHYGEIPSPKELDMIIEYSKEILKMLS